ncbi:phosphotransferase [Mycoplasma phocoenae]|uniref:Phosphotransferase n=1 Tax=Mycoplasma phocoenae TaxID=754517 RepID=A0A858U415_9MOLU|nr:phosphotransferase [Mycoplasma phocoenae]QJG67210.1 phosphotransferase [Mycoplasma phocoenae]
MKLIKNQGFTNKTFHDVENNRFVKEKQYDEFNHKVDYFQLNRFDFSPKTISNDEHYLTTEFIEGVNPEMTNDVLIQIGKSLIQLHNSKLKLPPCQLSRRFKIYRKKVADLKRSIPVLDKYYKKINLFLRNVDQSAPCHNDYWKNNLILEKDTNKLFVIDWEYASMGDVHFDLAYIIEQENLSDEQIKVLLNAYGDDYSPYKLQIHRILVDALIVLWVNKFPVKPFDESEYIQRIETNFSKLNSMENDIYKCS